MSDKKDKRFITTHSQDLGCLTVIVDRETGVNYLKCSYTVTPLLDRDGKPIITPIKD